MARTPESSGLEQRNIIKRIKPGRDQTSSLVEPERESGLSSSPFVDSLLEAVREGLRHEGIQSTSADRVTSFVQSYLKTHPTTVPARKICAERRVPMELMLEGVRHGLIEVPLDQASRLADCYSKLHRLRSSGGTDVSLQPEFWQAELDLVKLTDRLVKSNRKASQAWEENNKGRRSEYWARKRSELGPEGRERRNEYMRLYRERKRLTPIAKDIVNPVPTDNSPHTLLGI